MRLTEKLAVGAVFGALAHTATAKVILYDDFSSGTLNPQKWEVRRDPEGQEHFDEYFVANEEANWVFHTQQYTPEDRRTYLVPTHKFTAGDRFYWEANVVSREGDYGNLILVVGEEWTGIPPNRCVFSAVGYNNGQQPFDEIGVTNVIISFYKHKVEMLTVSPQGDIFMDDRYLQNEEGVYDLYVGSFTGDNGVAHLDYDNFYLTREPRTRDIFHIPEPTTFALLAGTLALANRRKLTK